MPLHLLGKKSWNVYNADNVARVRRDEAIAKANEEAEEQRMQEIDAQRRLAILRGQIPPPLTPSGQRDEVESKSPDHERPLGHGGRERKKRKRTGEDDTEYELRLARDRSRQHAASEPGRWKSSNSAPIVDGRGHIDLLGDEKAIKHSEKNEEAEKEAAKKRKEYEDQYTMRFSNAAGREGLGRPWYAGAEEAKVSAEVADNSGKDVWGNEDPGRRRRDAQRLAASDPLVMMRMGASKVRELKKVRQNFSQERESELRRLRKEEKRRERRHRRDESSRGSRERHGHGPSRPEAYDRARSKDK